ncbi:hypothetical protein EV202_11446 [Bacteroides heparinolyticus]|uniref:Uncharacterized protein n=1 Tax=Prevotella heparinolytica TaxID=28113 RepID=A0A4R2LID9_9BACE|nr:hypothetical protein EV202_11446 [Bacteroides heparinolyticus]
MILPNSFVLKQIRFIQNTKKLCVNKDYIEQNMKASTSSPKPFRQRKTFTS